MKLKLVTTLCLLMLMPAICYATATSETGDTRAIPVSAYGVTSGGTVTNLQVDSDGKLVISGGGGGDSVWDADATDVSLNATNSGKTVVMDGSASVADDFSIADEVLKLTGTLTDVEIQAAVDTLESGIGGTIMLNTGVVELSDTVTISGTDPIRIIGQGYGDGQGTRIDVNGITGFFLGQTGATAPNRSFIFENLVFKGDPANNAGSIGVDVHNTNNVTFDKVKLNTLETGVRLRCDTGQNMFSIEFRDCVGINCDTTIDATPEGTGIGGFINDIKIFGGYFNPNDSGVVLKLNIPSSTTNVDHVKVYGSYFDDSTGLGNFIEADLVDDFAAYGVTFDGKNDTNQITFANTCNYIDIGNNFLDCLFTLPSNTIKQIDTPIDIGNDLTIKEVLKFDNTADSVIEGPLNNDLVIKLLGNQDTEGLLIQDSTGATLGIWDKTGRVGIGTSSPTSKFSVQADAGGSTTPFRITRTGGNTLFAVSETAGNDGVAFVRDTNSITKIQLHSDDDSYFNGGGLAVGKTTVTSGYDLDINNDALVGNDLTVIGDINVTGALNFNDSNGLSINADTTITGNLVAGSEDLSISSSMTLTGAQMMSVRKIYVTGAAVIGLTARSSVSDPSAVDFLVKTVGGTHTVIIDPNPADYIELDGTEGSDGAEITSAGATGDVCRVTSYFGDNWSAESNSWT